MYRNCVYLSKDQCCRLFHWDEQGNRITTDHTFYPYLFTETTGKPDAMSLFNTPLKKKTFQTQYERYKYTQDSGMRRLFENIPVTQQFLIDRFNKENDSPDFSKFPIKVIFVDIEYYVQGAFVGPDNPTQPINVITIYDSLAEKYITWGTGGDFKPTKPNSIYHKCVSEKDMLNRFMEYLEKDYPDILSGWNSEFFDLPYLINRIAKLFCDDEIKRLSPVGNIYTREIMGKFGRRQNKWYIEGIACLDYMDIYKTFIAAERESFKLNAIAEQELGEKKIDYGNIDLGKLADTDWQKFVEYNIQDVYLLVKLDEKKQYLQLVRMLAYVGLTPFEAALGTLITVTGLAVITARHQGQVVPTFEKDHEQLSKKNEGAFVAEPLRGFQDYVMSIDVDSLYPNTMITLNLSPETKMGTICEQTDNTVTINHVSGKQYKLSFAAFTKFVKDEQIAISKCGVLFTQKKKGIFPIIVDKFYDKRVQVRKEERAAKKKVSELGESHPDYKMWKDKADKLTIIQHTIKILINRIYGYFGNKHNPLGDDDIARSITLTGQAVIKESGRLLTDWMNERGKLKGTPNEIKRVVYSDTDSCYISLKPVVDSLGLQFITKDGKASKEFLDMAAEIESYINAEIVKWGIKELNSNDCRFHFKRESICDTSMFLQKKRYVLHILDLEGIPCNKFKYVGVEVVRTTLPKPIKPSIKKLIELMISTKDRAKVNELLTETYETFKKLPIEDIAFVMGTNNVEGWIAKCEGLKPCKGMPWHIKAAFIHNKLLEKYDLTTKYEPIVSGDKIRFFYVKTPNKYACKACAYKYYWPKELNEDLQINHEIMFEKMVFSILQRFYDAVNWRLQKPGEQVVTDLFDFLKA